MATIALYANKISCMPDAITNIKKTVVNFSSRLSDLKTKSLQINESVCNLSDVIDTIRVSTLTQEEKINSVEAVQAGIEQFVNDAAYIDGNAADLIRQQKNDFYEKFAHLKPKCEKSAAIKAMSKIGVKNFAKLSLKALKTAYRETVDALWKNGFKKSFKDGLKNFGKIFVKTFIFDIDDFTQVKDGKRVWNLMADQFDMKSPNKNWIIGDGELIPSPVEIPGKLNPNKLTTAELMGQDMLEVFPDTIPYNNCNADLTGFAVTEAQNSMREFNIDEFLNGSSSMKKLTKKLRTMNTENANKWLFEHAGKTVKDYEKLFGLRMTWHEDVKMKKCFLVPMLIHANVGHVGAVSNFKFIFKHAPDISALIGNKILQFAFRFGIGSIDAAFE